MFECNICFETADEPVITPCGHLFWFVQPTIRSLSLSLSRSLALSLLTDPSINVAGHVYTNGSIAIAQC